MNLRVLTLTILLSCSTLPVALTDAALSPESYRRSQDNAPEKLIVAVLHVSVKKAEREQYVTAKAIVLWVRESRSRLRRGQKITIRYTTRVRDPLYKGGGGASLPILSKGKTGAFLRKRRDIYQPAARHLSFVAPQNMRDDEVQEKITQMP